MVGGRGSRVGVGMVAGGERVKGLGACLSVAMVTGRMSVRAKGVGG